MNNTRETVARIYNAEGYTEKRVIPKEPTEDIHIYLGQCGYKLSIGNRHLSLGELQYIVDKINALRRYGG